MLPSSGWRGAAIPTRNRFALLATRVAAQEARHDRRLQRLSEQSRAAPRSLQGLPDRKGALGMCCTDDSGPLLDGAEHFIPVYGITPQDADGACADPRPFPWCVLGVDDAIVGPDWGLNHSVPTRSGRWDNVSLALDACTGPLRSGGYCTGPAWGVEANATGVTRNWTHIQLGVSLLCVSNPASIVNPGNVTTLPVNLTELGHNLSGILDATLGSKDAPALDPLGYAAGYLIAVTVFVVAICIFLRCRDRHDTDRATRRPAGTAGRAGQAGQAGQAGHPSPGSTPMARSRAASVDRARPDALTAAMFLRGSLSSHERSSASDLTTLPASSAPPEAS